MWNMLKGKQKLVPQDLASTSLMRLTVDFYLTITGKIANVYKPLEKGGLTM